MSISLGFDESELGFLPDAFGFVWTDGIPGSSLALDIVDGLGESFSFTLADLLGDSELNGTTTEDRFFGVRSVVGIQRVTLRSSFVGANSNPQNFEIDHVQYGQIVPEPPTAISMLAGLFFLFSSRLVGWRCRPVVHISNRVLSRNPKRSSP